MIFVIYKKIAFFIFIITAYTDHEIYFYLKHYSEGNIGPAEISFNYGPDMLACSLVTIF
jgi:hypothetical protein